MLVGTIVVAQALQYRIPAGCWQACQVLTLIGCKLGKYMLQVMCSVGLPGLRCLCASAGQYGPVTPPVCAATGADTLHGGSSSTGSTGGLQRCTVHHSAAGKLTHAECLPSSCMYPAHI